MGTAEKIEEVATTVPQLLAPRVDTEVNALNGSVVPADKAATKQISTVWWRRLVEVTWVGGACLVEA